MPIPRTPMIDDDGTGMTGTVFDNNWKQQLYDQIDAGAASGMLAIANPPAGNLALTLPAGHIKYIRILNNVGPVTITAANPATTGDVLIVQNTGGYPVSFPHVSASGQFTNFVTSAPTPLAGMGTAIYLRQDDGRWLLISHEQGAVIAPTFQASAFTTEAGVWTVDAGDVVTLAYVLKGTMLTVSVYLNATSASTNCSTLSISNVMWGGYSASRQVLSAAIAAAPGLVNVLMQSGTLSGATKITFQSLGTFPAQTNTLSIYGQLQIPVS